MPVYLTTRGGSPSNMSDRQTDRGTTRCLSVWQPEEEVHQICQTDRRIEELQDACVSDNQRRKSIKYVRQTDGSRNYKMPVCLTTRGGSPSNMSDRQTGRELQDVCLSDNQRRKSIKYVRQTDRELQHACVSDNQRRKSIKYVRQIDRELQHACLSDNQRRKSIKYVRQTDGSRNYKMPVCLTTMSDNQRRKTIKYVTDRQAENYKISVCLTTRGGSPSHIADRQTEELQDACLSDNQRRKSIKYVRQTDGSRNYKMSVCLTTRGGRLSNMSDRRIEELQDACVSDNQRRKSIKYVRQTADRGTTRCLCVWQPEEEDYQICQTDRQAENYKMSVCLTTRGGSPSHIADRQAENYKMSVCLTTRGGSPSNMSDRQTDRGTTRCLCVWQPCLTTRGGRLSNMSDRQTGRELQDVCLSDNQRRKSITYSRQTDRGTTRCLSVWQPEEEVHQICQTDRRIEELQDVCVSDNHVWQPEEEDYQICQTDRQAENYKMSVCLTTRGGRPSHIADRQTEELQDVSLSDNQRRKSIKYVRQTDWGTTRCLSVWQPEEEVYQICQTDRLRNYKMSVCLTTRGGSLSNMSDRQTEELQDVCLSDNQRRKTIKYVRQIDRELQHACLSDNQRRKSIKYVSQT